MTTNPPSVLDALRQAEPVLADIERIINTRTPGMGLKLPALIAVRAALAAPIQVAVSFDASGNGNHAVQSDPSKQPVVRWAPTPLYPPGAAGDFLVAPQPAAQPDPTAESARLEIADSIKTACANGYLADRWEDVADRIASGAQPAPFTPAWANYGQGFQDGRDAEREAQPAAQPEQATVADTSVNSGALRLALNSLRRGSPSQREIADELELSAIRRDDQPPQRQPLTPEHLSNLLDAMHREANAKANLNEWMRASPALAVRTAQAEDEWVKAVKHLVSVQMEAEKYVDAHGIKEAKP